MNISNNIKTTLKEQWLGFCKKNAASIKELNELENSSVVIKLQDDSLRLNSLFILGTIAGLNPESFELITLLLKLNSPDQVVKALELDFDPLATSNIPAFLRRRESGSSSESEL
jgi:hypothetical protein